MEWRMLSAVGIVSGILAVPIAGAGQGSAVAPERMRPPAAVQVGAAGTRSTPRAVSGVPVYAPAASQAEAEVIDAARLLGIPLVRTTQFPTGSPVAFFCASALADRQFPQRLRAFVKAGGRALLSSRLAGRLGRLPSEYAERIFVLPSHNGRATVLALPQVQVDRLRNFVLHPLGLRMEAPSRVSLTLVGRETLVLENHNAFAAGVKLTFLARKWPAVHALAGETGEFPLSGSSVSLQAPPKAAQRFQIVSRE